MRASIAPRDACSLRSLRIMVSVQDAGKGTPEVNFSQDERDAISQMRVNATRALADCCDDCRALLRDQLSHEERGEPWPRIDPETQP